MSPSRAARVAVVVLTLAASACGGSPSTPTSVPVVPLPGATAPPPTTLQPPPAGSTVQVSGVVVDTEGRPIAGARLISRSPQGGVDVQTDAGGAFAFTHPLSQPGMQLLQVDAASHESRQAAWNASPDPVSLRIVLQRSIVAEPAAPVTATLSAQDLPYYVGEPYESDYCSPCKLIRIGGTPQTQRTRIALRWTGDEALHMWASTGYTAWPAQSAGEHSRVIEVWGVTQVFVGLPLGAANRPQQLTRSVTFQLSVAVE